jgi:hypothetical protein
MQFNQMWLDGNPKKNPNNSTRQNLNIVITDSLGAVSNEKGFKIFCYNYINKTPIGKIELNNNDFIIFSITDNGVSEIGHIDSHGKYSMILNQLALNFKLTVPIHGEYQINDDNERIITWLDGNVPRVLNIDNLPNLFTINKLDLFNKSNTPLVFTDIVNNGGFMESGAYYPIVQLVRNDSSTSNWMHNYLPVYITDDSENQGYTNVDGVVAGTITNKAIKFRILNIDTDYEKINVGFIKQIGGVKSAHLAKTIDIIENVVVVDLTTSINLDVVDIKEVLIDKALYQSAKLVTQQNNILYLGDLKEYKEPNYQTLVNNIQLRWTSEKLEHFVDVTCEVEDNRGTSTSTRTINILQNVGYKFHKWNNQKRHFQHGEVYAFYVKFEFSWGWGRDYVLNGRLANAGDKNLVDINNNACEVDSWKKYQVDDTCSLISTIGDINYGDFSFWENEDETYPLEGGFPTGNVRHFKFPSLNWMRRNVYKDDAYGCEYLDILGLNIAQLDLSQVKDCQDNTAISYSISFAKRKNSATVLGQSAILFKDGGNYREELNADANGTNNVPRGYLNENLSLGVRVHPFEMLYTKASVGINYVRYEYQLETEMISSMTLPGRKGFSIADYTGISSRGGAVAKSTSMPNNIRSVKSSYVPNNVITDNIYNLYLEEFVNLEFGISNYNPLGTLPLITILNSTLTTEKTFLTTLMSIKKNVYDSFDTQELVSMGVQKNTNQIIYGGDTYICDYNVNTLGNIDNQYTSDITINDKNHKNNGRRIARRLLVESVYNINLRHVIEDKTAGYTDYYPKNVSYLEKIERDKSVNLFALGYNTDYNALLDINLPKIWKGKENSSANYPFRIIRSDSVASNWRNFKLADYYDLPKNQGRLINLTAGRDYMYIHFENSLFRTKGKNITQSTSDIQEGLVYLGSGDIFDYEPFPILHDKLGQLGTQHKYSCLLTKFGYLFLDKGKWFLVNDKVKEISEAGLYKFFSNNSDCHGDNPYVGNGVQSVYDEQFKRFIISVKNKTLIDKSKFKGVWKDTDLFKKDLQIGDIVFKDGKYLRITNNMVNSIQIITSYEP